MELPKSQGQEEKIDAPFIAPGLCGDQLEEAAQLLAISTGVSFANALACIEAALSREMTRSVGEVDRALDDFSKASASLKFLP